MVYVLEKILSICGDSPTFMTHGIFIETQVHGPSSIPESDLQWLVNQPSGPNSLLPLLTFMLKSLGSVFKGTKQS